MLQHASWLLLALNLFHVKEIHIFTLQTCCQPIIQFVLIGRSPSSFGHLPRQSYSPKIVRAGGPLRVAVEKKRHIFDLFFFLLKIHPITSRAQKENDNASTTVCTVSSTTVLTLVPLDDTHTHMCTHPRRHTVFPLVFASQHFQNLWFPFFSLESAVYIFKVIKKVIKRLFWCLRN